MRADTVSFGAERRLEMKLGVCKTWAAMAVTAMAVLSAAGSADAKDEGKLVVKRLVLAHGVDAHEPQEPTTHFKKQDDRVYAFVEVANPTDGAGKISVVFQPPSGGALAEIPLDVKKSPRFRTWAFTRKAHEAGQWGVTIRDEKGRVLAKESFTVE
ncbi:MAG: DUF2914 domain-containing protein [Deltaproteobacteria bacterium]|nr:DUF2914 domain-containing protein [Deltaproteobacteria bacterium]